MMYTLMFLFFIIVLVAFLYKSLDWYKHAEHYLVFLILTGLFNFSLTHILVISGYLAFPLRFAPNWVYNNFIYDLFLLPAFALIIIVFAQRGKKQIIIAILFGLFIALKDLLLIHYTELLLFHKWTLYHSFFGAVITFYLYSGLFTLLKKYFRSSKLFC